ncbi:MAG: hypothetical protein HZB41_13995 [Ignavibacteriae bacterium]|nr:hypothetical protein [Ignavibacteriota bacterium]
MQISNIGNAEKILKTGSEISVEQLKDSSKPNADKPNQNQNLSRWQKDILLTALEKLENIIQMDDIHPLSRQNAAPIETYQEAIKELEFVKSPKFSSEAYGAQANLNPQDVMFLFTGD